MPLKHPSATPWSLTDFVMFPANLHALDRIVRLALGVALFIFGWQAESGSWVAMLRVFALYPLITAFAGWCPIYALLRFQTRR